MKFLLFVEQYSGIVTVGSLCQLRQITYLLSTPQKVHQSSHGSVWRTSFSSSPGFWSTPGFDWLSHQPKLTVWTRKTYLDLVWLNMVDMVLYLTEQVELESTFSSPEVSLVRKWTFYFCETCSFKAAKLSMLLHISSVILVCFLSPSYFLFMLL